MQCSSLLDPKAKAEYVSEVAEDYEEVRGEHYKGLRERRFEPLAKARTKAFKIDWTDFQPGLLSLPWHRGGR